MNKTYLGYTLSVLSALAFAGMSLFIKMGYDVGMSAWSFTLIQSTSALVMLGIMLAREGRSPAPRQKAPLPRLLLFFLFGAAAAISFNLALVYLSMSLSTILLFTYPAFVAIGAWALLGQRPSRAHTIALGLTLVGAVLTTNLTDLTTGAITAVGVGLAVLSAICHGTYMVFGESLAGSLSAIQATTYTRIAILSGSILLNPSVFREVPFVPLEGWIICIVASILCGVAPFLFLNRGIALIGANRAAIASVAELPFALGLGMVFQGDLIGPLQWVGAALILTAVVVSQRESDPKGEIADGSGTGAAGSL